MTTRRFRVTVDGETFEVEVEELTSGGLVGTTHPAQDPPRPRPALSAEPSRGPAEPSRGPAEPPRGPAAAPPPPASPPRSSAERGARPEPAVSRAARAPSGKGARVDAPLPGTVVSVVVSPGAAVESGQVLVVLEAMKMQNEIVAPQSGRVGEVAVSKGDTVALGDLLVTIE